MFDFSTDELKRYSQQMRLNEMGLEGQQSLKKARVLCVGLGGLGSPLLLYLAAAGVGILGLVDDDKIELNNLHRQILYRMPQLGQTKVAAAQETLAALNPSIQVVVHSQKLTPENAAALISQYDLIADGTDNFTSRYLIHDCCFQYKKTYVYASASQFRGYCSVFSEGKGPCLHCLFPRLADSMTCAGDGVLGVNPGILGVIQAAEIIKWILKIGKPLKNYLLTVDLLSMTFKKIKLSPDPECLFCANSQKLPSPVLREKGWG